MLRLNSQFHTLDQSSCGSIWKSLIYSNSLTLCIQWIFM